MKKNKRKLGFLNNRLSRNSKIGFFSALLALFLDQLTKFIVVTKIPFDHSIELLPILSFILVLNDGISFSLLSGVSKLILIPISLAVIVFIIWFAQKNTTSSVSTFGYGLIIGGAIGNVLDRILHGAVIDFVLFHYSSWFFPVFNVADTLISIGVLILLVDSFHSSREKE